MAHHAVLGGHPGQTRMTDTLRRTYYWPQMAADVLATVRSCPPCAKNRLRLIRKSNPMKLFPATTPLECVAMDLLGPLPASKAGNKYILVITDRFTKLTQIVCLRKTTAYIIAAAFCSHWVYKYGTPKETLTDNGPQFASKFLQETCQILGVANTFTSAYHPQTNGQCERYNRTLAAMLRCYVDENPQDWDTYAPALTYAYNMHVHRSTGTRPFDLVLSRPPPDFTTGPEVTRIPPPGTRRLLFADRLRASIEQARATLQRTQGRYKRDFDKRIRRIRDKPRTGGWVFLDPNDGAHKRPKLQHAVEGPYKVLEAAPRTVVIQRGAFVERVGTDRVTPAPAPESDAPMIYPEAATAQDMAEKNAEGETWLVESIDDHRKKQRGKLEFRVRWVGPYEPTWEPRANIPEELISRYLARLQRITRTIRSSD